jgi:hypothetical protein
MELLEPLILFGRKWAPAATTCEGAMRTLQAHILCLATVLFTNGALTYAETNKLPSPSRTIYKCDSSGKIVYSDEPCPGAKKMDIEPSRGLNKSTGREMIGTDVARERQRESIAEAVRPLTGLSPEQFAVQSRRMQIEPKARAECASLDGQLKIAERDPSATVTTREKKQNQQNLYVMRKRYKELRC